MKKLKSILQTIAVPFAAIALIMAGFFLFRHQMKEGLKRRTYAILEEAADQQRVTVAARLDSAYQLLHNVAAVAGNFQNGETSGQEQVMELLNITAESTDFHRMAVVDAHGNARLNNGDTTNIADRQYFRDSMAGKRGIERVEYGKVEKRTLYLLSLPILRDGRPVGVVFGSYDFAAISDILTTNAYGGEAYCYACDASGRIVIGSEHRYYPGDMGNMLAYFSRARLLDGMNVARLREGLSLRRPTMFSFIDEEGTWYAICSPMDQTGWFIVDVVPEESVVLTNQFINDNTTYMVVFIFLVGLAMVLYTLFHERRTIRRLQQEQQLLQESERKNDLLNRLSSEVLFQGEIGSGQLRFNRNFQALFGYEPTDGHVENAGGARIYEADGQRYQALMEAIRGGARHVSEEIRIVNAYGRPIWQRMDAFAVAGENGRADSFIGKLTNIERQKTTIQRLLKQAESDPLTGVMNRAGMIRRVDDFLGRADPNVIQALMMLDIDNFKHENDTYGHQEGDKLLKLLAEHLQAMFRASDYVCRMGGDEFAVFLKDAASFAQVRAKAQELCDSMAMLEGLVQGKLSVSVGVALFNRDGKSFEELYARADEALYIAKNSGKACFRVYGE